jgi:hypothetical protein
MEGPASTDEASMPTEPERMRRTSNRKAAKRTCFTLFLPAANILLPPPEEDIPERKKPRLQATLPAIAADADTLNASKDDAIASVASADTAGIDPVAAIPMQPKNGATGAPPRWWTPEEDTKLSDETTARVGKRWTKAEDSTLKDAIKKHNGKNWAAIAALVPGRTKQQCWNRCRATSDSKSDKTTARVGKKWTKEEDSTLKDAVEKHKGKNWAAIAALVPGRTKKQCLNRWHNILVSTSDETTARVGEKWTKAEDSTLKDAIKKHNGKNWAAIAALVPGRTKKQCWSRWSKWLGPRRITITQEEHGTTNDAPALV